MTTMRQTTETCALCGTINHRHMLTSYNTFGGQDTEFRSFAIGFDPLALQVHSCLKCGYAGYRISEGVTDELRPKIERLMKRINSAGTPGGDIPYVRMALLAELRKADDEMVGELWLRAAWMAEDAGKVEEAILFRTNAAARLAQWLTAATTAAVDTNLGMKLLRLGEIYRRVGEFEQATWWRKRAEKVDIHDEMRRMLPKMKKLTDERSTQRLMKEN
jgi:hypothetical protein